LVYSTVPHSAHTFISYRSTTRYNANFPSQGNILLFFTLEIL